MAHPKANFESANRECRWATGARGLRCVLFSRHARVREDPDDMNAGSKIPIGWTFAWLGVPLLCAVLRLLIGSAGPPVWVNVLVLLMFVAAGTLFVRERLQPEPGWIVPEELRSERSLHCASRAIDSIFILGGVPV